MIGLHFSTPKRRRHKADFIEVDEIISVKTLRKYNTRIAFRVKDLTPETIRYYVKNAARLNAILFVDINHPLSGVLLWNAFKHDIEVYADFQVRRIYAERYDPWEILNEINKKYEVYTIRGPHAVRRLLTARSFMDTLIY